MLDQNTIKQIEDIGFKLCTFDDNSFKTIIVDNHIEYIINND